MEAASRACVAVDGELEAGQLAHAREKVVGVDPRDAELAGLAAPDRQRSARGDSRCDRLERSAVRRRSGGRSPRCRWTRRRARRYAPRLRDRAEAPRGGGDPRRPREGRARRLRGLLVDAEGGAHAGVDAGIHLAGLAAAVRTNSTIASAIIGTITSSTKNSRSLPRKLTPGQSTVAERRPRSPRAPLPWSSHGAIAQLGERLDRTQEVVGSSPTSSTRRPSRFAGVRAALDRRGLENR